ncbi:hypothetical protein JY651_41465 [Pyxidicoccus parkwayensis]|uniref:Outer membrane protein beta-barrel domain-containing protein n=1 Tax=Pyxidicoccus parkwayensis TaxID=2813578 RepID=A0ABX7NVS3_9BACT|nr:hypothetical protein [Pyxidicoccus parkwaysis]QSQ21580.1 hypothetical protein JY651_41465 [Pyxidicoccus parkwaysis]
MQANKWQTLAAVAGIMVSATAGAQATGGGSFGNTGQIVISTDATGSLGYSTQGSGIGFISLEPGADYFLKQNLSVGAGMQLRAAFTEGDDPVGFGLNARAGYNIPLTDKVSVWPKGQISLWLGDDVFGFASPFLPGGDITVVLEGYAPFLFHVTDHFFVGGGPRLAFGLGDEVEVAFSVNTTIGGYF